MVPGHISLKLAEKIFFIGESIQLFEGGGGGTGDGKGSSRFEAHGCVLKERETEFYQKMVSDEQPFFFISPPPPPSSFSYYSSSSLSAASISSLIILTRAFAICPLAACLSGLVPSSRPNSDLTRRLNSSERAMSGRALGSPRRDPSPPDLSLSTRTSRAASAAAPADAPVSMANSPAKVLRARLSAPVAAATTPRPSSLSAGFSGHDPWSWWTVVQRADAFPNLAGGDRHQPGCGGAVEPANVGLERLFCYSFYLPSSRILSV